MICAFARLAVAALLVHPLAAGAETIRVATYDVGLSRAGPGLLLHELTRKPKPEFAAVLDVIQAVRPDVLLLVQFDHDLRGRALDAFRARLAEGPRGIDYAHRFDAPVNAGVPSGRDLDGDGLTMGPGDAFGWGNFPGNGGMAILSRLPIDAGSARTFRGLLWSSLPGALLPERPDGAPFPDAEGRAALRLSSRSHWDVPVVLPGGGRLHLLTANPAPPLFDGEEGFNRRRNHDEITFWAEYLGGTAFRDDQGRETGPPEAPLVLLGGLNADPVDGAGLKDGIARLLAHPALRDPGAESAGGAAAAQDGANARYLGASARDTADWRDDGGPGNLRGDYVLPSAGLRVMGSGVFWPARGAPMAAAAAAASAHRLVWADIELP